MADKQTIISILVPMSILPNCPANTDAVVEAFWLVLRDLDDTHVKAAAAQYLSTATFFPTPGQIRQIAIDLDLTARGIPTPAEAWGSVLDAKHYVQAKCCPVGLRLGEDATKADLAGDSATYFQTLEEWRKHEQSCSECHPPSVEYIYAHPIIEEAVNRMGGRDALFTDNAAADRARFIEAYRELVAQGVKETARLPEVKRFIDHHRELIASDAVKQLTKGMK